LPLEPLIDVKGKCTEHQADGTVHYIKYEELKFDGRTQKRMCMHQVLLQLLFIDRSTDIKKKVGSLSY